MRIGLMIGPDRGRYRHKVAQLSPTPKQPKQPASPPSGCLKFRGTSTLSR